MARFASLSSSKLSAKTKLTSIPSQTDYAEWITGQAYSEKAGTLWIEESYDLPVFPGSLINEDAGIVLPASNASTPARFEGANPKELTDAERATQEEEEQDNQEEREKAREEAEADLLEDWAALGHWSIATYPEYEAAIQEGKKVQTKAEFPVAAKATISFNAYAGAPFWRLAFESGEETKELRVYARAFERGKV